MTKKMTKKLTAVCGVLLLLAAGFALLWFTDLRQILYRLPVPARLSCALTLTVDGKPYPLERADIEALTMANGAENTVCAVKTTDSGAVIRCKGGEYGGQPFAVRIQLQNGTEITLPVTVIVANNWEITHLTLQIAADTETMRCTYSGDYRMYHDRRSFSGDAAMSDGSGICISGI